MDRLEEWAISNLLTLANEPGIVTRKGMDHEHNSTINLTWYNNTAIMESTFSNWSLDWAGSLGSDHTLTRTQGSLLHTPPPMMIGLQDLGYVIDDLKAADWGQHFRSHLGHPAPLPDPPTSDKVKDCTRLFHDAI